MWQKLEAALGNARIGQIFKFVKSIGAMLISISQSAFPTRGINKDSNVWQGGARTPPKNIFKNNELNELKNFNNSGPTMI